MELSAAETIHEVPVLHVSGDVDLSTADALRDAVEEVLGRRSGLVVVDLTAVTFLDSAGLRVLDELQQQASGAESRIALVCPQRRLIRLLEITGLDQRFAIHNTAEGAAENAVDDG